NHRPCHLEDIQRYNLFHGYTYIPPADAWIVLDQGHMMDGTQSLLVKPTCADWTSSAAGLLGAVLRAADGDTGYGDCSNSFPVLCCTFGP
ncbi:MAG: hypothetical protein K8L99_29400, partial [Anaerolineae bacterium]|nr:hypothetical protein [Anaerolineae bacterium]